MQRARRYAEIAEKKFSRRQIGAARGAARCGQGNRCQATRAVFRVPRRRRSRAQAVYRFDNQEHDECNNKKVDDVVDQRAISNDGQTFRFSIGDRYRTLPGKIDEQTGKIHLTESQTNWWHDDALNKRRDYFSKRYTYDYCNRQVDHVSTSDELFEFLPHGCVLLFFQ